MHLSHNKKNLLLLGMIFFFGIQIWHTVYNQVNWPFCSHNFYYHRSPLIKDVYHVTLEDDAGRAFTVDTRHVLPIEGYRCGSVFREIFSLDADNEKKEIFSRLLLERLNSGGWKTFDERGFPLLPHKGNRFINLRVESHKLDTKTFPEKKEVTMLSRRILYEYGDKK